MKRHLPMRVLHNARYFPTVMRPHPISTFLFSPFVHAIGYAPQAPVEDPDL